MNPESDQRDPEESVQAEALNAMFAKQSGEENAVPLAAFSGLSPVPVHGDATTETRLSAGWALLTAAIGVGRVAIPNESDRKKQHERFLKA
jgi:hypothetical protein